MNEQFQNYIKSVISRKLNKVVEQNINLNDFKDIKEKWIEIENEKKEFDNLKSDIIVHSADYGIKEQEILLEELEKLQEAEKESKEIEEIDQIKRSINWIRSVLKKRQKELIIEEKAKIKQLEESKEIEEIAQIKRLINRITLELKQLEESKENEKIPPIKQIEESKENEKIAPIKKLINWIRLKLKQRQDFKKTDELQKYYHLLSSEIKALIIIKNLLLEKLQKLEEYLCLKKKRILHDLINCDRKIFFEEQAKRQTILSNKILLLEQEIIRKVSELKLFKKNCPRNIWEDFKFFFKKNIKNIFKNKKDSVDTTDIEVVSKNGIFDAHTVNASVDKLNLEATESEPFRHYPITGYF